MSEDDRIEAFNQLRGRSYELHKLEKKFKRKQKRISNKKLSQWGIKDDRIKK
jgi:hypothetical protein